MATVSNEIKKLPITALGSEFISNPFLPEAYDEYYLRNIQNPPSQHYRQLSQSEIEALIANRNNCKDWSKILVTDSFDNNLIKNCNFYGLVRIGRLENVCLEFSDLRLPVGLYNSTIVNTDFGENVVIHNVNYLSNYIIGNEVMITNVNELITTNYAKFGNGILKDGEPENVRIWMELCNENGGRKVIPFVGMTPGDAYLWSKFRDDEALMQKFKDFTGKLFDSKRGYYGKIGDRTIIKNCRIIKDVWIGSDAYLKGANKLKNLTINSGPEGKSQIGEGCEMVNGIMDYGCRAFYGVKAVRFVMASHSQLKYGARLINSYLGNNSTISCCEVLNSLIFPAHEQHHNNSFLCAALVMGQSNIAAGATLGSNHNSRGADGEIIAGRGFWPGLCVSLKHNSRFASFTILAKGDYSAELDIPIPFSLVSNDVSNDRLVIMPGYWFMYNMYALERNGWKYIDRDKRKTKVQHLECDYLAPDTICDMVKAISLFQKFTGKAWYLKHHPAQKTSEADWIAKGKQLLEENDEAVNSLTILADHFENTKRPVLLIKVSKCYHVFKEMISLYFVKQLISFTEKKSYKACAELMAIKQPDELPGWLNVGGQLIPQEEVKALITDIKKDKITGWDELHAFYENQSNLYKRQKLEQSISALKMVFDMSEHDLNQDAIIRLLDEAVTTRQWMTDNIFESRAKDYSNEFRNMPYENDAERDEVIGKLQDNSFIKQQREQLNSFKLVINDLKEKIVKETTASPIKIATV